MGELRLYRAPFVTFERPHCVWEYDLPEVVLDFLAELDPKYFETIAEMHAERIRATPCQVSATALRGLYFQGLETLFALTGALIQAPTAVPAWLVRYKNEQLEALIRSISESRPVLAHLHHKLNSWEDLAGVVFRPMDADQSVKDEAARSTARMWRLFAEDFLDPIRKIEYNSIKHGMRIRQGGFRIAIGRQVDLNTPCPPQSMMSLGGSQFGSSFFIIEGLDDGARNFRVRKQLMNWNPDNMVWGARMISLSIQNVVACLRSINNATPESIEFRIPDDADDYMRPWSHPVGVERANFAPTLTREHIQPLSKDEILRAYHRDGPGE
jgi:hypothetical protein